MYKAVKERVVLLCFYREESIGVSFLKWVE